MLTFQIFGEPMHNRPPRFSIARSKTGKSFVSIHAEPRVTEWQDEVRKQLAVIKSQMESFPSSPISEPVNIEMTVFRTRPPSSIAIHPDTKPDWDNLSKPVMDCLEGSVLVNDSQIVSAQIYLRWAYMDYSELSPREFGPQPPGLIIRVSEIKVSDEVKRAMNAGYKRYLADHGLEYITVTRGTKKHPVKKTVLAKQHNFIKQEDMF